MKMLVALTFNNWFSRVEFNSKSDQLIEKLVDHQFSEIISSLVQFKYLIQFFMTLCICLWICTARQDWTQLNNETCNVQYPRQSFGNWMIGILKIVNEHEKLTWKDVKVD